MAKLNAKACKDIMNAQIFMMCTIRDAIEATTEDTPEQDALTGFYDTCVDVFNKFNAENGVSCTRAQGFMLTILGLSSNDRKSKEEPKDKEEPEEEELKEVDEDDLPLPPEVRKVIKNILELLKSK